MVRRPGTGLIGLNCFEMFWLWEERGNPSSQHLASWVCSDHQGPSEGERRQFHSRGSLRTPLPHYPSLGLRTQGQLWRLSTCFLELFAPGSKGGITKVTVIILENSVGLGLKPTLLFQDSPFSQPFGKRESWLGPLSLNSLGPRVTSTFLRRTYIWSVAGVSSEERESQIDKEALSCIQISKTDPFFLENNRISLFSSTPQIP